MAAGIIRRVSMKLTEKDLTSALRATVPMKEVRRFGASETVKLVLDTETAAEFVTVGHTGSELQPISRTAPSVPPAVALDILDSYATNLLVLLAVVKLTTEAHAPLKTRSAPRCMSLHHQAALRTRKSELCQYKAQCKLDYSSAKRSSCQRRNRPVTFLNLYRSKLEETRRVFPALPSRRVDSLLNEAVRQPPAVTQVGSVPVRVQQVTNTRTSSEYSVPSFSHTISSAATNKAGNKKNSSTSTRIKSATMSHDGRLFSVGALLHTMLGFLKNWLSSISSPFSPLLVSLLDAVLPFVV